jgi:hypothetical protein
LNSCISRSTSFPALGLYLRRELLDFFLPRDDELPRDFDVLPCELRADALRRLPAEVLLRELPLLLLREELLREVERRFVAI